ncbi:MAG: hypothetical protein WEC39_02500 [Patescibacteria group bacterium]
MDISFPFLLLKFRAYSNTPIGKICVFQVNALNLTKNQSVERGAKMFLQNNAAFLNYPRPATLLGVLWLGLRLGQGINPNKPVPLDDFMGVYLRAQQQGYLNKSAQFHFERNLFPFPYSMGLEDCFSLLDSINLVILEDGELLFLQSVHSTSLPMTAFAHLDKGGVIHLWSLNLRNIPLVIPS